uniref:Uncharacterized protein n=1 Tax=Odontella aurita TaxID=265563 RepID=A0A7S4NB03_9STRA|mmetsp:Transcript_56501/g.169023  ORF Transcript_56501/g.169023 Transcript_56501/m.169023 type:complete len:589 (+) Transcript_56501:249-2015(+)
MSCSPDEAVASHLRHNMIEKIRIPLMAMRALMVSLLLDLASETTADVTLSTRRNLRGETLTLVRHLEGEEPSVFHEPLFPLQWNDWLGFSGATVGLILAAGGGIGGGGILVPIFILVLRFAPKHAIALSSSCVFGGAVANTILNAPKRHPLADRPLISWDLILVMEPPTIAGALGGVLANKSLPDAFIIGLLVIVLSLTAWHTLTKARKLFDQETLGWQKISMSDDSTENDIELPNYHTQFSGSKCVPMRRAHSEFFPVPLCKQACQRKIPRQKSWPCTDRDMEPLSLRPDEAKSPLRLKSLSNHNNSTSVVLLQCTPWLTSEPKDFLSNHSTGDISFDCAVVNARNELLLGNIIEEERHVPRRNILIILGFFLTVLFVTILKGGGSFHSPIGIQCGSASFWIAEAFVLCCIFAVSMHARSHLIGRTQIKDELNYQYVEGDIRWDGRATCIYPAASILAGFFAGMFGIGGGIIKGPLMLAMGVLPAVASATAACMILFTSLTATASFVVFGLMITDYAWFSFGMGFFATVLGQLVMSHMLRKYRRNSYIAFCIGIVVLLSAILLTVESIVSFMDSGVRGSSGLCSSAE